MILISIHPEFAVQIRWGEKKYEFRKSSFYTSSVKNCDYFAVYEPASVGAITMILQKEKLVKKSLNELWKKTRKYAGIDKSFFNKYYKGKQEGVALKIKKVIDLENQISLKQMREDYSLQPPQNYYILENKYTSLNDKLMQLTII